MQLIEEIDEYFMARSRGLWNYIFIERETPATGIQFRLGCLEKLTIRNAVIPALLTGRNQVSSLRSHPVTSSLSQSPHILAVVDFTCDPSTDANGCLPPGCEQGDPKCDPGCGKNYCCLLEKAKSIPMAHPLIPSPSPPMFPPSTVTANPCAISL